MCFTQSTGEHALEILQHVPTADHRYPEGNGGTDRVQWTEDGGNGTSTGERFPTDTAANWFAPGPSLLKRGLRLFAVPSEPCTSITYACLSMHVGASIQALTECPEQQLLLPARCVCK